MNFRSIILSTLVAILLPGTAMAQGARTQCDDAAAFPYDPERAAEGVPYERINAAEAINACAAATKARPGSGRIWFQYGRALERGGALKPAIEAYRTARDLGHPGGSNNLGELHRDGKGMPRDPERAMFYFREAAQAGYPEAAHNLALLLSKAGYVDKPEIGRLVSLAASHGYPISRNLRQFADRSADREPPVTSASVQSPPQGSPLRREILEAVRPYVEAKLNAPIEFRVLDLKVSGDWAFTKLMPQRPGGAAIDIGTTPMGKLDQDFVDGVHTEAVLRRVGGIWRIQEAGIGTTDVWYAEWCDRLPKALFRTGDEPGTCDY